MKYNRVYIIAFISLCLFLATPGRGQEAFVISNSNKQSANLITDNVYTYIDNSNRASLSEIATKNFSPSGPGIINLGIVKNTLWIKFNLKNTTAEDRFILKVNQPVVDSLEVFIIDSTTEENFFTAGEYKNFNQRIYKTPNYLFPLTISQGSTRQVFIKIRSSDHIQLPILIGTRQAIMENENTLSLIFGIYAGVVIIMILYNAFIFFSVKDWAYYSYILFILFVGLTQAVLKGYAFQFLWPGLPEFALKSTVIIPMLSGITTGAFMKSFLNLRKTSPALNIGVTIFISVYVLFGLTGIFYDHRVGVMLLQSIAFIGSIYALVVGSVLARKGIRIAKFFLAAYSVFLVAVLIFVLTNFNVFPYNSFTAYILEIGSILQIVMLSFALADKINTYRREQSLARKEALRMAKVNERLVREQNILLEKEVAARTAELQQANTDLKETLEQLKMAQAKLVDSEKMASLGQLTAGVAHEINNPINFVASNVKPLELDIHDIFEVLSRYENIDPGQDITAQLKAIEDFKKEIDVPYIAEEIKSLLAGIKDGASRTAEIVKNLKNFVRLDQSHLVPTNLNEGIESTLVLMRNTFPQNLVIKKDLGNIGKIECSPGKINQVFMNIISNAVQAIKDKEYHNGEVPTLSLSTTTDGNDVRVSIKDNGIGMSNEVLKKIYEPFFTTKDVGEGTGLGMSIVKGIIDNHNGSLTVNSAPGKGSEFVIALPVKSPLK